jgi:hypothetical protein
MTRVSSSNCQCDKRCYIDISRKIPIYVWWGKEYKFLHFLNCNNNNNNNNSSSGFGGLEVACWPLEPKFKGSNPAEAVEFFRAKKILSTSSFGREVKLWVPCRRFTECKWSLNDTWKWGIFRLNLPAISRPHISTVGCYDLSKTTSGESWKHLNYRLTTLAFSAQGEWQRGNGGESC